MNRKPLLYTGIALIVVGGIFTLVVSVLRAGNVKLSGQGFDGDSSILVGVIVAALGLVLTIYATAKKIDLGPVEIEQEESKPEEVKQDAQAPSPVPLDGPVTTLQGPPIGDQNGTNQSKP